MNTHAAKYIASIRNPAKKTYAVAMQQWMDNNRPYWSQPGKVGLSHEDAIGVKCNLDNCESMAVYDAREVRLRMTLPNGTTRDITAYPGA